MNRFWEKTRQLTPAEIAQALHDVSNRRAGFFYIRPKAVRTVSTLVFCLALRAVRAVATIVFANTWCETRIRHGCADGAGRAVPTARFFFALALFPFWSRRFPCGITPEAVSDRLFACASQEDELEEVHEAAAQEGQSEQIAREEKINTHFICLT